MSSMSDAPVTLINVFEGPIDQVDDFIGRWRARAELISAAPGFRDSRLHQAISPQARFQFVNVAHWDSREAWEAASSSPEFRAQIGALDPHVQAAANPALYRAVVDLGGQAPA
jgi:heme-degrading monooxygenase HmoA